MKKTTQNWYAFDNPFDPEGVGKMKMAVHFQYEVVKCWRTGYRDFIVQFVMDYEGVDYSKARSILNNQNEVDIDLNLLYEVNAPAQKSVVDMPEGYVSILDGVGNLGDRARKYLTNRGFDLEVLDSMGFGYCRTGEYQGYIIIPFKRRGSLQYFIGRDFIGNYLRYKNPNKNEFGVGKADLLYNEDALDLRNTVYLTEGWSDAATIGKAGIASLGWSLSREQKSKILNSSIKRLVIIPDIGQENGESFYQKGAKMAMDFLDEKEVVLVDLRPLAENGKDVNEIGREPVMNLIKETPLLTIEKSMEIILN